MPDTESPVPPVAALSARRDVLVKRVRHIRESFRTVLNKENVECYRPTYQKLAVYLNRFDELQDQTIDFNATVPAASRLELDNYQKEFDQLIQEAEALFLAKAQCCNSTLSSHPSLGSNPVRLPKLELAQFTVRIEEWRSWYNLFKVSVHQNPALIAVEKFQYLLSSLKGEPLALVNGLDITEGNYGVAWQQLCKRYHSERRHIFHHCNGLLDLPEVKFANQLQSFLSQYREHSQALETLGHPLAAYDGIMSAIVSRKLSPRLKRCLEDFRGANTDYPKLNDISAFLEKECISAEECASSQRETKALFTASARAMSPPASRDFKGKPSKSFPRKETLPKHRPSTSLPSCPCCPEKHGLFACQQFRSKNTTQRREFVRTQQRCLNCLGQHFVRDCPSQKSCLVCQQRHHTMLHESSSSSSQALPNERSEVPRAALIGTTHTTASTVLLGTIQLRVKIKKGSRIVRGLLDTASQGSFLTHKCIKAHGLTISSPTEPICGIAGSQVMALGRTKATITTVDHKPVVREHEFIVINKITEPTPAVQISTEVHQRVQNLHLADPDFHQPGDVDLLIGAELHPVIMTGRPLMLGTSLPVAYETDAGLVLMGCTPVQRANVPRALITNLFASPLSKLHETIQRFWQVEEAGPVKPIEPPEDPAETLFRKTTQRLPSGRFSVQLPFASSPELLGDSRKQALQRFYALERMFRAQPHYRQQYTEFMQQYQESGFMTLAPADYTNRPHYFMPHHGVVKESSSTTKLRVVFDASAKTSTGVSLNEILHVGPALVRDIKDVLLSFRRHRVVLSCDIRQMYLQVELQPDDRRFHLIFWRPDESSPLQVCQMNTVTFGVASSAFLAIRTLHQLAHEHGAQYPRVAKTLLQESYVDDIATGEESVEETRCLRGELVGLLAKGRCTLRKWASNELSLLSDLAPDHLEVPFTWTDRQTSSFSILGLQWIPSQDAFSCRMQPACDQPQTKRGVLSSIATIFDPCGCVTPVVFIAKSYMQQLWLLKIGWDDPLPSAFVERWNKYLEGLPALENIRLSRSMAKIGSTIQIHAFCDASELGYATVIYMRPEQPVTKPQSTDPDRYTRKSDQSNILIDH